MNLLKIQFFAKQCVTVLICSSWTVETANKRLRVDWRRTMSAVLKYISLYICVRVYV